MIAVFDFDGTICYGSSMLFFFKDSSLFSWIKLFLAYFFSRLTGRNYYVLVLEKNMKGKDIEEIKKMVLKLPPVKGVVEKAKELQEKGFEIYVLSYTVKELIEPYLEKYGIKAKIFARELEIDGGVVEGFKKNWLYDFYFDFINGKRRIIKKLGIKPSLCIGDNKVKDAVCSNFLNAKELEKNYIPKIKQFFLARKIMKEA